MSEAQGSPIAEEPAEGDLAAGETAITGRANFAEPDPAQHPFYPRIGRIASSWYRVERILDMALWQLADLHTQDGACQTSQIVGIELRCRAIISMGTVRGLSDTLIRSAMRLMHESFSVAHQRERILHDPWWPSDSADAVSEFKGMPYPGDFRITEEMQAVLRRIADLEIEAWLLRNRIADELLSLRKTPG